MEERGQMTFFRSYWEALHELPDKDRLKLYDAVFSYFFADDLLPLSGIPKSIFALMKPHIDCSIKRSATGKQGGSKPKANAKQTESKSKAKSKLIPSDEIEEEIEVEEEIEREKNISPLSPREQNAGYDFSPRAQGVIRDWIAYKKERRESYKQAGLNQFLAIAQRNIAEYGEDAVCELISSSMANGYKGVTWDRLGKTGGKQTACTGKARTIDEDERAAIMAMMQD